jgi:hypothetical protein
VYYDRNGRPLQPKQRVTAYLLRKGGIFEDVGKDFALAVTRLHQIQAQLHGGVSREEAARDFVAPDAPRDERVRPVDGPTREVHLFLSGM